MQLLDGAEEILDNRQVVVKGNDRMTSEFEQLLILYKAVIKGEAEKIPDLARETEDLCSRLKSKIKTSQAITVDDLYRCLYGRYITVTPTVTYKNIALKRCSLGQKATVLIKIYLAQGTNSIIIDSHDDHLDNEFIMAELVGALRQAKGYRQIILASNNGNVVVNSDAEQVVIAEKRQGHIAYSSGSLENPVILGTAVKVLEGGVNAFRKRQQKYRLGT